MSSCLSKMQGKGRVGQGYDVAEHTIVVCPACSTNELDIAWSHQCISNLAPVQNVCFGRGDYTVAIDAYRQANHGRKGQSQGQDQ